MSGYSLECLGCSGRGKIKGERCENCGGSGLSPVTCHSDWVNQKEPELRRRLGTVEQGFLTAKWIELGLPMPDKNGSCGFLRHKRSWDGTINKHALGRKQGVHYGGEASADRIARALNEAGHGDVMPAHVRVARGE